jgi:hypothetical protein
MAKQIVVLDSRKFVTTDPKRLGKMDTIITYQVDGARAAFVILPTDTPSQPEIKAAIEKEEAARAQHVGQTFSIG